MREAWAGVLCAMGWVASACSGAAGEPDAGDEFVCTPGESRACACSSGATGAQVCTDDGQRLGPCMCAELDGGMLGEDAGGAVEAGMDAGSDAGADAGPRDAGPPWGECWLVPQAGCEAGEACRHSQPEEPPQTTPPSGPPECQLAGTLTEYHRPSEGPCSVVRDGARVDLCQAGLFCQVDRCRRYCEPGGEPCPALSDGEPRACLALEFSTSAVIHYCGRAP